MIRVGVVGLGKMGISHLAAFRAHPDVELAGVCDTAKYSRDVLAKYTGLATFADLGDMLDRARLDAVVIATPSHLHAPMVRQALERGLHVFCEKPFCLDPSESMALADLARGRGLVTQVGYHNRYVATFAEVKRLLDLGVLGRVTHVLAESYGPVVLKPSGSTWRTRKVDGGGCLYDYAAHPIDLLTWYLGPVDSVSGSVLTSVFSRETDDEVVSTLHFPQDVTAQVSVSWSDESQRKMSTKITVWGTAGRITADRQEIQVFLRRGVDLPDGYGEGWNVKYTTELSDPTWYYLRGEEYSAQVDDFVRAVHAGAVERSGSFADGTSTDRALALIVEDADRDIRTTPQTPARVDPAPRRSTERLRQALAGIRARVTTWLKTRRNQ